MLPLGRSQSGPSPALLLTRVAVSVAVDAPPKATVWMPPPPAPAVLPARVL